MFRNSKGGSHIANEIVFTELKFRNVSVYDLANELEISEQTLIHVLRFELDEQEQIKMLRLINNLPNKKEQNIAVIQQYSLSKNP